MTDDVRELFEEFDALNANVWESRYQFFLLNLRRWFAFLDGNPPIARIVLQQLNAELEFDGWYERCLETMGGMVGSGTLHWPDDPRQTLALQLMLFRKFDRKDMTPYDFCSHFLYSENDYDVMIHDLSTQLFRPMVGDLRRYLQRALREAPRPFEFEADTAPASDRVVRLDHNSAEYIEAVDAVQKVEEALEQANDYPDQEDREQRIAEMSAGRRLFMAVRVRVDVVVGLLGRGLAWLATQFAGQIIGKLADLASAAIRVLLNL